jgi:1-acyl-sn-glycerol-3-phosphate acyltransferase
VSQDVIDGTDIAKWDPDLLKRLIEVARPIAKRWYRSEVRGLDRFPPGKALVVSNHSGGLISVDTPIFAVDFYDKFGYDRPIYTLSHDLLFTGPTAELFVRMGFIRASRHNATRALRSGGVVIVFPGGDYDAWRSTFAANKIDFNGRTGYVKTALEARVSIVPVVSIGGQENHFHLWRGDRLAKRLGMKRLLRTELMPLGLGIPFGLSPVNFPLPTKIVTQVLEPIDAIAEFGEQPDILAVDAHIRGVMQKALDELAKQRRFPVLG